MSRLVSRIMLAMLMLPAALTVYMVTAASMFTLLPPSAPMSEAVNLGVASGVTWAFVAAWWTSLWHGSVRWTRARVGLTAAAVAAAIMVAVLGGWISGAWEPGFGAVLGGVLAMVSWLTATVFIWRETAEERAARARAAGPQVVACPRCGYNLTGLRSTLCPECGGSWTVEELVASQPARRDSEL